MNQAIEEFDQYACRRGVLRRGDRFLARGGPVYVLADGRRTSMAARGPFTFRRFCRQGDRQWIEAVCREQGTCVLLLGPQSESPVVPGLMRRPYRITRVLGDVAVKKDDVQVGQVYTAKVTDKLVPVRIVSENPHGGWNTTNLATGRSVRIKSAQRLRAKVDQGDATDAEFDQAAAAAAAVVQAPRPAQAGQAKCGAKAATSPTAAKGGRGAKVDAKAKGKAKAATRAKQGDPKAKRASGLDAAARVLAETKKPMGVKEIVEVAFAKGYWSTGGKTPEATIYSAIIREIAAKGKDARFKKVDRGRFARA